MAVGQNQGYHFGVGAPPISEPILVVGWDVHWGVTGIVTHGDIYSVPRTSALPCRSEGQVG